MVEVEVRLREGRGEERSELERVEWCWDQAQGEDEGRDGWGRVLLGEWVLVVRERLGMRVGLGLGLRVGLDRMREEGG